MALTDPTAAQDPQQTAPDQPGQGLDDVIELIDKLGNAIKQNAERSAMAVGQPDDAKGYAQAALFVTQALVALVPYQSPGAPNAPGDNAAKKGD